MTNEVCEASCVHRRDPPALPLDSRLCANRASQLRQRRPEFDHSCLSAALKVFLLIFSTNSEFFTSISRLSPLGSHSVHNGSHTLDRHLVAVIHGSFLHFARPTQRTWTNSCRCGAWRRCPPPTSLTRSCPSRLRFKKRKQNSVVVVSVVFVPPLYTVGLASTGITAASRPSVHVLLLGPAFVTNTP